VEQLEFNWWSTNRTFEISSPYTNKTHQVARYDVFLNTAPRPEGYLEDYETINEAEPPFTQEQAKELYAELASGAESG
jgi:alpha,alpha-trehalase